ncbi:5627_t:CDS:2, partial [Ambispora gerdemannii]
MAPGDNIEIRNAIENKATITYISKGKAVDNMNQNRELEIAFELETLEEYIGKTEHYSNWDRRRKEATARVFMKAGSGQAQIRTKDGKEKGFPDYFFMEPSLCEDIYQPLTLFNKVKDYDLIVRVKGGGFHSQAEAIRLGVARALLKVSAEYRTTLKSFSLLTRDARRVERKKAKFLQDLIIEVRIEKSRLERYREREKRRREECDIEIELLSKDLETNQKIIRQLEEDYQAELKKILELAESAGKIPNIKHRKSRQDQARGKNFLKLRKEIEIIIQEEGQITEKKLKGLGGLPVGSSGQILLLLSGGIDSPVAAYQLMKRGLEVNYCHFYSQQEGQEKITALGEKLQAYNSYSNNIYLIDTQPFLAEIRHISQEKYRLIILKRMFIRTACWLAQKLKIDALATGDSLAQVASQTLASLAVIQQVSSLIILQPLISWDKKEIITQAQKIGTYELSLRHYQDCCSLFEPQHPITKPRSE